MEVICLCRPTEMGYFWYDHVMEFEIALPAYLAKQITIISTVMIMIIIITWHAA